MFMSRHTVCMPLPVILSHRLKIGMKSYFLRRAVSRGSRRTVSFTKSKSAASLSRSKSGLKLGQKPSAIGRRRPAKRFTWNCVNIPPCACKCFTAVMTLLLFIGAIVMVILYFHKQKRPVVERNNAMIVIREFMILQNESFKGKNDSEILDGAQKLVQDLSELQLRNDELEKATNNIFRKLLGGWKPFSGNLYFFSESMQHFHAAEASCRDIGGSHLIDITSQNEEEYLEEVVRRRNDSFYIGLVKDRSNWKWVTGEPLATSYWALRNVGQSEGTCAAIGPCQKSAKCWHTVICGQIKYWICKLKPNPKFL